MHADETAAGADVTFESSLLIGIKNVAGRAEKDHRLEAGQILICEDAGIFRGHDTEVVQCPQILYRLNAVGDGRMSKGGRLGKHEDLEGSGCVRVETASDEQRQQRNPACATPCLCTTDAV